MMMKGSQYRSPEFGERTEVLKADVAVRFQDVSDEARHVRGPQHANYLEDDVDDADRSFWASLSTQREGTSRSGLSDPHDGAALNHKTSHASRGYTARKLFMGTEDDQGHDRGYSDDAGAPFSDYNNRAMQSLSGVCCFLCFVRRIVTA
jgi:hypothetical protein